MSSVPSVDEVAHPRSGAARNDTFVVGLRCRACGHEHPQVASHLCELCFGPLEVVYDYEAVRAVISRERIEAGPPTLWRYSDLLPVRDGDVVSLGEGFTPLIHARNLGGELGLHNLHLKDDTQNPTNSFKDRVVSVAINWALRNGFTTIACASTGNLATAVAGATIVPVAGNYDDVNRLCTELADDLDWGFCNINLRPYYSEGSKTLTFETAEQLGWRLPDEIVIPVASGCQFVKHRKAAAELIDLELVTDVTVPRFTGAQALGCSPVASAFARGTDIVEPVRPNTIARSIAIGNPSDGGDVVRIARQTGGEVESVTEEEIVEGIELLAATEGIFTETAGGVTVAVLRKLARQGRWEGRETIAAYITGHGLKTLDAVSGRHAVGQPIDPQRRSVKQRLAELGLA